MPKPVRRHRVLAAFMVPALAVAVLAPAGVASGASRDLSATKVTATDRVTAAKSASGRLAETDPRLLARNDSRPVRVMLKLDYDSLASYAGGIRGLAATSPRVTGRQLDRASQATRAYEAFIARTETRIVRDLRAVIPSFEMGRRFRVVYGGISAVMPARAVEAALRVEGVVAVHRNTLEQPLTDSSPEFLNVPPVYEDLGSTANAGQGVIYGNLDTGLWPEHPSFADLGNLSAPPGPARDCDFGDNPLTPAVDPFVCQNKLIGGVHMTDDYDALEGDDPYAGTARDGDGHGTHTTSTAAGNIVEDVQALGRDLPGIHGLAPGAWVIEYKVCGPQGCYSSDSAAAVGQAILDGVDVINFSISGGTSPFTDPVELAFLDAYDAGIFVATSAGNEGPGASTANHLSSWVTSVAASTQTREFASTLTLTAGNGDGFSVDGATITPGAGPLPVVMAANVPGYDDPLCGELPASGSTFDGLIVACQRGGQARVWKGFVVASGGGEGMVLYNPAQADVETDNHWLPTIHVANGAPFVAFMSGHTGVTGSFTQGEARDGQGDVMAAFSSRGPAGDFIKPDVTAPGVQILAGASPTPPTPDPIDGGSPPGNYFQAIAGTSMSSPHVAGAAILLRAVRPAWTPGEIKSALMTTAITDVLKEDLTTPADPFDYGAGRIDIGAAAEAPLTFDATASEHALYGSDPLTTVHLNIASINARVMPGRITTTRVARNTSGVRQRFDVSTEAPAGTIITVSPGHFTLRPGHYQELEISIWSETPIGSQVFGSINIEAHDGREAHLPVAFVHTQGEVSLTQSCDPNPVFKGFATICDIEATNRSFTAQDVDLDTYSSTKLRIIGASGAQIFNDHHARRHNVTLAAAEPGVPSVGGTGLGYLGLEQFGVTPDPIGDEEIINYSVPAFEFAGQEWDAIGVDANGYIIVGGGTIEDNECCDLPAGPSPAPPNNVLAPFWTDLDGTTAPGVFVAILTDTVSGDEWVVVEFQVEVFGTSDLRTFQVWIGVNGVEDIVYEYAEDQAAPTPQDFLVGAENQLGEGDMEAVLPTDAGLTVTSSDAVPGGSVSYTISARARSQGEAWVRTRMFADGVPGVTIVRDDITIFKP